MPATYYTLLLLLSLFYTQLVYAQVPFDIKLDSSFGTNGLTTYDSNPLRVRSADQTYAINLQTDDKIILSGYSHSSVLEQFYASSIRINTNGVVDSSFGHNGLAKITPLGSYDDIYIHDAAIQDDDKIVLCGIYWYYSTNITIDSTKLFIGRFTKDGQVDSTFGHNGFITYNAAVNPTHVHNVGRKLALQKDGKILVLGYTFNRWGSTYHTNGLALLRLLPNGQLDTSFATNGLFHQYTTTESYAGYDLVLDSNDKIIISGESTTSAFLMRLDTNGVKDVTFGTNGIQTDSTIYYGLASIVLDSQQRITGVAYNYGVDEAYTVRYLADGTKDTTFGTNGVNIFSLQTSPFIPGNYYDNYGTIALLPHNNILGIGYFRAYPDDFFVFHLMDSTGQSIASFGDNGTKYVLANGYEHCIVNNGMRKIKVLNDSSFLLTSSSYTEKPLSNYKTEATVFFSTRFFYGDVLNMGNRSTSPLKTDDEVIVIYPNPSNDGIFNLSTSAKVPFQFEVYDVLGRKITSGRIEQPMSSFSLANVTAGCYFFYGQNTFKKIIVK